MKIKIQQPDTQTNTKKFQLAAIENMRSLTMYILMTLMIISMSSMQTAWAQKSVRMDGQTFTQQQSRWYMDADGTRYEVNPTVVTVKFKQDSTQAARSSLRQSMNFSEIRQNALGYVDLVIPAGADPIEYVQMLQQQNSVVSAQVNTFGEYVAVPNDPSFPVQWHLPKINAPQAWDVNTGSDNVIIAVLDSGTDVGHQDLAANVWINPGEDVDGDNALNPAAVDHIDADDKNGIDDDGNGKVDDLAGWDFFNDNNNVRGPFFHGTHVAGIVAASTDNAVGVAGVGGGFGGTPGLKIMAIGVGDNFPDGSILDDAIIYAADNGADVITLSLSVGSSLAIDDALDYAANTMGVFINNASGNNGPAVSYPATDTNVVAVGATGPADIVSVFSNTGPEVELSAPGEEIWSTQNNNTYDEGDGTSYASPQVAAVAGLILSCDNTLTNSEVRNILTSTSVDLGNPGRDELYGFGRLDAKAALDAACAAPSTSPWSLSLHLGGNDPQSPASGIMDGDISAAIDLEYQINNQYAAGIVSRPG